MSVLTSASGSVPCYAFGEPRTVLSLTRVRVMASWDARDGKPFGYDVSVYSKETESDEIGMSFTLNGISKTGFDETVKFVGTMFGKEIGEMLVKCEAALDKNVDSVKVS